MQEAFLHFIWKFQYFNHQLLETTEKEAVTVLKQGFHNHNAGPDFLEGKVKIGDIEWSGSIEIHVKSSDWILHKHQDDSAYNNVVLHVVWTDDLRNKTGQLANLPTLELKNRVDLELVQQYDKLLTEKKLACGEMLQSVSTLKMYDMLDKAVASRLEKKSDLVLQLLEKYKGDWEEVVYVMLTRNFGFKVNDMAFTDLAEVLPWRILRKHLGDIFHLEALLFGQAGFLEGAEGDDYYLQLRREYDYLKHKYGLRNPLQKHQWKFLRTRPANFPSFRIAQLASFSSNFHGLLETVLTGEIKSLTELSIQQSSYWKTHFDFGKEIKTKNQGLGVSALQNILINTFAPVLAAYSRNTGDMKSMERALSLLESLPPEDNKITRIWGKYGKKANSAFDSQGYIMQYNTMCLNKQCASCSIGVELLTRSNV